MDFFSSRELAIGFWLAAGLAYFTYSDKFRLFVKNIFSCFCSIYILVPIIGLGFFVATLSCILIEFGLWDSNQYKNVTLWFICVDIYALFQVSDVNKGVKYFKETAADLLMITVVFEFIVTFYSFDFWFELFFIPIMTIIMLTSVMSEKNNENKDATNFLRRLISLIGFIIIFYIIYLYISESDQFFTEGTIVDFIVPILLTIGVFPYLYIFMIYVEYERLFRRLDFKLKDKDLGRSAKLKVVLFFNFNLSHLKRWDRYIMIHGIETKVDFNESIKRVRSLLRRDKKNIPVTFSKGWSHYEARRYLNDYGLVTSYYDHLYNGEWTAYSEPLKLGQGVFGNRITYYIDGNEGAVKCLTLVLGVDEAEIFDDSLNEFREIGNHLFRKSFSSSKNLSIETKNVEGEGGGIYQTHTTEFEGRQVMIQKRKHVNRDTFELRLSFSVDKESFKYVDTI